MKEKMNIDPDEFVHEYIDEYDRTWWVVAQYRDGCYYAPQRRDIVKRTGCSTIYGSLAYVYGNAHSYRRRGDAVKRARQLYK